MRYRADRKTGRLVEADTGKPVVLSSDPKDIHAPRLNSDAVDVVSPITGRPFDSKSGYYRHLKDNGCHIVESSHEPVAKGQEAR